ncbi:Na(+)/glucose symporter [Limihaloglobus sulfuriphilus]|uniref:Na(+)/glucose symporter n=1 Tax=Limihaloglobus sulfuriphilus TaxID=1851148 RepID=A0A1Q2MB34_9BACT|nr:sodium:solute symporter [Limihaloglobus sulfuriphilus]AQQ69896.1 Na(+)/glucose symporter [Limihaloglobus sulfuriphilus]
MGGYFSVIDYIIIASYGIVLLGIGFLLKEKASESLEDYFLGGRRLPWWLLGCSGMASWISLTGSMVIVAFLYLLGPRGIYVEFRGGAGLILIFMMIWTGKWHRRSGCITGAEYMKFRFGDSMGAATTRLVSVLAVILSTVAMLAMFIKGLGIFMAMFIPLTPWQCSLLFIGVVTIYTIFSGFYGVVVTDVLQSVLFFVGTIGVCIYTMRLTGSAEEFGNLAASVSGNQDWMSSVPSYFTNLPKGYETYQYLFWFAVICLLQNILFGSASGADPKYFAARSDKECSQLSILWGLTLGIRWVIMIAFTVLGIILISNILPDQGVLATAGEIVKDAFPQVRATGWNDLVNSIASFPQSDKYAAIVPSLQEVLGDNWQTKMRLIDFHGNVNPEAIMPVVLLQSIPVGFRGIIMVALIASIMSSFDSAVNTATGFFTRDLYQFVVRPKASHKELIMASYIFIFALVLVSFLFAFSLESVNDIWGFLVMGLGTGLMVPGILKFYWWRFNTAGFNIGMLAGMILAAVTRLATTGGFGDAVAEMPFFVFLSDERTQFFVLFFAVLFISVAAALLTRPTKTHILENYYIKTRPFGLWGPLKSRLKAECRLNMEAEHRRDLIAVPFAMLCQVTFFILLMQFVLKQSRQMFITLSIFAVSAVILYVVWYSKLDKMDYPVELEPEAKA